jgi:hypothetical protein
LKRKKKRNSFLFSAFSPDQSAAHSRPRPACLPCARGPSPASPRSALGRVTDTAGPLLRAAFFFSMPRPISFLVLPIKSAAHILSFLTWSTPGLFIPSSRIPPLPSCPLEAAVVLVSTAATSTSPTPPPLRSIRRFRCFSDLVSYSPSFASRFRSYRAFFSSSSPTHLALPCSQESAAAIPS